MRYAVIGIVLACVAVLLLPMAVKGARYLFREFKKLL